MSLLTVGKQTLEKMSGEAGREWDGSYEMMLIKKAVMQTTNRILPILPT